MTTSTGSGTVDASTRTTKLSNLFQQESQSMQGLRLTDIVGQNDRGGSLVISSSQLLKGSLPRGIPQQHFTGNGLMDRDPLG